MLRQGIAIICRTKEEFEALAEIVHKTKYTWRGGSIFKYERRYSLPIRISINVGEGNKCISKCETLDYELNPGITEVYEASDFLHNIIISRRLKGE